MYNPGNAVHFIADVPVAQNAVSDAIILPQAEANHVCNVQGIRVNQIATKELVREILAFIGVGTV